MKTTLIKHYIKLANASFTGSNTNFANNLAPAATVFFTSVKNVTTFNTFEIKSLKNFKSSLTSSTSSLFALAHASKAAWVPFALSNEQTTETSKAKLGVALSASVSLSKLDANFNSGLLSPRSGYENVKFKISESPSVSAFKVLSRNFKTAPNASRAEKTKKIGTRKGAITPIAHFAAVRRIVSMTFSRIA